MRSAVMLTCMFETADTVTHMTNMEGSDPYVQVSSRLVAETEGSLR